MNTRTTNTFMSSYIYFLTELPVYFDNIFIVTIGGGDYAYSSRRLATSKPLPAHHNTDFKDKPKLQNL